MPAILLLGSGYVAGPCLNYLLRRNDNRVTVAARRVNLVQDLVAGRKNATAVALDVNNEQALEEAIGAHDIVISLIPYTFHAKVIKAAVKRSKHVVTTSYVSPAMMEFDAAAKQAGITVMNEIGVDPGIDHLYAVRTINEVHREGGKITAFTSYCGGLPAPECSNNPLGYKFSWSSRGVLLALRNNAKYLDGGAVVDVAGPDLMSIAKEIPIYPAFAFEGYPNRDSTPYTERYKIPEAKKIIRGTLRYKGFPAFIQALVKLGLLDDSEVDWLKTGAAPITWRAVIQKKLGLSATADLESAILAKTGLKAAEGERIIFGMKWLGLLSDTPVQLRGTLLDVLCATFEEKMQYKDGERDMVMLQHRFDVELKDGKKQVRTSTGLWFGVPGGDSAMATTVGVPCGIATQMVLDGVIKRRGVIAPLDDELVNPLIEALEKEVMNFLTSKRILILNVLRLLGTQGASWDHGTVEQCQLALLKVAKSSGVDRDAIRGFLADLAAIDAHQPAMEVSEVSMKDLALRSIRTSELGVFIRRALLDFGEASFDDLETLVATLALHKYVLEVQTQLPNEIKVHYVSYINFMRVGDYRRSLDSFHLFFDFFLRDSERERFQYASLELAILHSHFGHRKATMAALKESIEMSRTYKDKECLSFALACLQQLELETGPEPGRILDLHPAVDRSSLGQQASYLECVRDINEAKHAIENGHPPAEIFRVLERASSLKTQKSVDVGRLIDEVYALAWQRYGHDLSAEACLELGGESEVADAPGCRMLAIKAMMAATSGNYKKVGEILTVASTRFPAFDSEAAKPWMKAAGLIALTRAINRGQYFAADILMSQLSPIVQDDPDLCEQMIVHAAVLDIRRGRSDQAYHKVWVSEEEMAKLDKRTHATKIERMLLTARIQIDNGHPTAALRPTLTAQTLSERFHHKPHLHRSRLLLVRIFLSLRKTADAFRLARNVLPAVASGNDAILRAEAELRFAEAGLALVVEAEEEVRQDGEGGGKMKTGDGVGSGESNKYGVTRALIFSHLGKAIDAFASVEAVSEMKGAYYLKAIACNWFGLEGEREKSAEQFCRMAKAEAEAEGCTSESLTDFGRMIAFCSK
ncbi:hypothetical protein HK101_009159 [Irineochytrium annulatum]|nr:hypothetical protein HK101_009159 [Irineochytrium annulatum]